MALIGSTVTHRSGRCGQHKPSAQRRVLATFHSSVKPPK